MTDHWTLDCATEKADGSPRRVGVEIELQGIDIDELADLVARTLGGRKKRVSSAEYEIDVEKHGTYRVEVDFALLKELAREREDRVDGGAETLTDYAVDLLGGASTVLVPCEIVSPPIPVGELPVPMDALVVELRRAGAKGTRQSVLFAFGVHLNVEPPDLEAKTITRYLRAFVCLYDWIIEEGQVDVSRQMSPYIKPYGRDYELLVGNPDYSPDLETLIEDYLAYNPSRDRAMDMLPLFAYLDEQRVHAKVDDPLIKARPAFHYRLANSCIDEDGWSIAHPWNRWAKIEQLAADPNVLAQCARAFVKDRRRVLRSVDRRWTREVSQWLDK